MIIGLIAGIFSGIYMLEMANSFGQLTSSLFKKGFGPIYIAVIALAINLAISFGGSAVLHRLEIKNQTS